MNILISSCLTGLCCRYDGGGKTLSCLPELMQRFHMVPFCPEIYGGMPTPRSPAERQGTQVICKNGKDVTAAYQRGAEEALKIVHLYHCPYAVLKERSPSCGFGQIYDGSFSGCLVAGSGVTAELLAKNGVRIFGESQAKKLLKKAAAESRQTVL